MVATLIQNKLAEIPEDWGFTSIGECCDILDSQRVPLSAEMRRDIKGDIPYYGANGHVDSIDKWIFDEPLILMAEDGGYFDDFLNRPIAYKVTGKCWVNNHAHVLRPKQAYWFDWVFYQLEHMNIVPYINGSTRTKLNQQELVQIRLPVAPLPEQRKIAEILSTVDEAIEKSDTIIQETQQLKKGLMQKLFTEGIRHSRFKETKIGQIPEEWEIKTLGNLGGFFKGTSIAASEIVENGLPCIRYGDIYVQYENDNVVTHFSAFISRDTAERSRRIYTGDILFAGTGETQEDIGKCVAYTMAEEAYAGGDLVVFRPQKEHQLNSLFLSYCMNCGEVAKAKIKLGQGLSIFHIYSKNLKTLCVPLSSVSEQNKIAEILSGFDIKIKTEQAYRDELEQLKKGLMQVLLTGKVRVKV